MYNPEYKTGLHVKWLSLSHWHAGFSELLQAQKMKKHRLDCELSKGVYHTASNTKTLTGILNEKEENYEVCY